MGYSYIFRCKECNHTQKLYEGWGFMIHDQSAREYMKTKPVAFHYKTERKLKELMKKYPDIQLKMEYRIFRCHYCLQIFDKLFVQFVSDDKILHETHFRCMNCHTTLKHTNIHSLKYAICPKCKSPNFKKEKELVLWS